MQAFRCKRLGRCLVRMEFFFNCFLCLFVPLQCMAHRWSDCSVSEIGCDYTCSAICLHFWSGRSQVTAGILVEYLICPVLEVYMIYCWNKCCLEIYFLWVFLFYLLPAPEHVYIYAGQASIFDLSLQIVLKNSHLCVCKLYFLLLCCFYTSKVFPFQIQFLQHNSRWMHFDTNKRCMVLLH